METTVQQPPSSQRPTSAGLTSLMLACQQGLDYEVREILQKKPLLVSSRDRSGKTALHYCAENSTVSCVEQVLAADSSVINIQDEEGYSALHLAVISGNKVTTRYLIKKSADVNLVDNEKHSCVHWATVCGEVECLDMLIDAGANPSTPDIHGAFPIHYAAQMCGPNSEMGNNVRVGLAVLRKLLSRGVDVTCRDQDGREPLLWAASAETRASKTYCPSGSSDAILALINAGANVSAEDKDGLTALHCASSRGHLDCLETLITLCGAEVDSVDSNGCSALFYAVTLGHADCTHLLLKFGGDANRQDRKGRTPAHCGAAKGQLETIKILAQNGANLWLRNVRGDLPLHEAVQSGRKDLVHWLMEQQPSSVNLPNSNGRTALHIAAITNNVEMCKVLMDSGAYVNPIMRNSKGQLMTPLDAALHRGNRGCAKYLQLHGAMPASKMVEKNEFARSLIISMEDSGNLLDGKTSSSQESSMEDRRLWSETAAQTEVQKSDRRDADVQVHMTRTELSESVIREIQGELAEINGTSRPAREPKRRPIIAKVYVHTIKEKERKELPFDGKEEDAGKRSKAGSRERKKPKELTVEDGVEKEEPKTRRRSKSGSREKSPREESSKEATTPKKGERRSTNMWKPRIKKVVHIRMPMSNKKQTVKEVGSGQNSDYLTWEEKNPSGSGDSATEDGPRRLEDSEDRRQTMLGRSSQRLEEDGEDSRRTREESRTQVKVIWMRDDMSLGGRSSQAKVKLKGSHSDPENPYSPLSSTRSLESNVTTLKDSGYSDDFDRVQSDNGDASSEGEEGDRQTRTGMAELRRKRRIRRQLSSVGESEKEPLGQRQESEEHSDQELALEDQQPESLAGSNASQSDQTMAEGRRLLRRPTITQEVQNSLRKYQLERKLFQELQELKRHQIRSGRANENVLVKRLVDRFRKQVISPGMKDFAGPFTYKSFEKYLYDQLKRLSSVNQAKIPKPKPTPQKSLLSCTVKTEPSANPALCVCRTYMCHHAMEAYGGRPGKQVAPSSYHNSSLECYMNNNDGSVQLTLEEEKNGCPPFQKPSAGSHNLLPAISPPSSNGGHTTGKKTSDTTDSTETEAPPLDDRGEVVNKDITRLSMMHHTRSKSLDKIEVVRTDVVRSEPALRQSKSDSVITTSLPSLPGAPRARSKHKAPLYGRTFNVEGNGSPPEPSSNNKSRIPTSLLATIGKKLVKEAHPDDIVIIEMTAEGSPSKYRQRYSVRELQQATRQYQISKKKSPHIKLEEVLDPNEKGPVTFEIRHGQEKNVFRLPADKLKANKKWQVTFTIGKNGADESQPSVR